MGILTIIELVAAIAAIGFGIVFVEKAWTGFKQGIAAPYIQAQVAADQKVVTKANEGQAAAEGERDHARADTASCVAKADLQTKEVDKWKLAADRNAAAAKEARTQAMREATAQAPRIADLQAKAAAAPMLMACEVERDKAKNILRDQLRQKRGIVAMPVATPAVEPPPTLVK